MVDRSISIRKRDADGLGLCGRIVTNLEIYGTMGTPLPTTDSNPDHPTKPVEDPLSTQRILRAFTGSLMAGTFTLLFYKMTIAIATTFANKPGVSDNITVINLSSAVRTLVVGVVAMGTGVFGMAAIGLFALGIQMIGQRLRGAQPTPLSPDNQK